MCKLVRAGVTALLLGTLLVLPACEFTSPGGTTSVATPTQQQKVECLTSFVLGFFDGVSLIGEHSSRGEVVFTALKAGVEIVKGCYSLVAGSSAHLAPSTLPHTAAVRTSLLDPPTVSTTRLADTCLTYLQRYCADSSATPGFKALPLTWESSATADEEMTNCSAASLTGTYQYNIPAELVVGTDSQQKTFLEPLTQFPSGDARYDTLPPTSDTTSDFAAVAQSLYESDHIEQFFNSSDEPSDSVPVTIPAKMKAHLTIHLRLEYRYGTAVVTRGSQATGTLWMYVYTFTYDTTTYSNHTYLQQTNTTATC